MLLLARLAGVAVLVWFYLTAKEKGEPTIQWALLGFIGYWLTWWLVNLTIVHPLVDTFPKNSGALLLISQAPAIIALTACFFIRKKLISNAAAASENTSKTLD